MLVIFRYIGYFSNVNRLPTPQTCHKHIPSSTSVIDVPLKSMTANWKSFSANCHFFTAIVAARSNVL